MKSIKVGNLHVCLSDIRGITEFEDEADYFGFRYMIQGVPQIQSHDAMFATFHEDLDATVDDEVQIRDAYNLAKEEARALHTSLLAAWTKAREAECRFCIKW